MPDDPFAAEGLLAELNVAHVRRRQHVHVRWACIASLPLWVQAFGLRLPGSVAWVAVLGQGYATVMAGAYVLLAAHWSRRAAMLPAAAASAAAIHARRAEWQDVRSALWSGLATASTVPWIYAALGRSWSVPLRAGVTALAVSLFVLLVLLETAAELVGWHRRRRRRARPAARRAPPRS